MVWIRRGARIEANHMIRTSGDHHTRVKQRTQRQKARHPLRPQYVFERWRVKVLPGGLAIEDDSELLRPRDRLGVGKVAVRDGEPPVTNRMFTIGGFISVEQHVERAAPSDVRGHLPAKFVRRSSDLKNVLAGHGQHAAIARIVISVHLRVFAVRLAQVSRPDQDPAVHHDLERAGAQPIIAPARDEWYAFDLFAYFLRRALPADEIGDVAAHGHFSAPAEFLISAKTFRSLPAIYRRSDADAVVGALHALQGFDHLSLRRRALAPPICEQLRRAENQSRWFTLVVFDDFAVGGLRRFAVDLQFGE